MRQFTFELVVYEGNDEFWEEIGSKTGCDEVTQLITNALAEYGLLVEDNIELKLTSYINEE